MPSFCSSWPYLIVEYHRAMPVPANPTAIAAGCFVVFTIAAYAVYALRNDKG